MTGIATIVSDNPVAVLTDEKTYDAFILHVKSEINAFKPDLSTENSRKKIGSLAYKITRSKTAIDAAGKKLNEDARAKINKVDAARRKVREELDALAEAARKPLTDWEDDETARAERIQSIIRRIEEIGEGRIDGAQQLFDVLFHELEEAIIIDETFGDLEPEAKIAKVKAREKLTRAKEVFDRAEADRLELERLRAAEQERQAQKEARRAEEERLAQIERERAEEAERARLAEEDARRREQEAAENARQQALREAEEELLRLEREKAEAIERAEAEKRALIEAQERAERERREEEQRIADEQAARERDRAHRGAVLGAAKDAIIAEGADDTIARKLVIAIAAGKIPNVTLRF